MAWPLAFPPGALLFFAFAAPASERPSAATATRRASFRSTFVTSFPLEDGVLQGFGGTAEELAGAPVVAARECEIAPRRPREGVVAHRGELCEAPLGVEERLLGLVESTLAEEGTAEDDPGHADLDEEVDTP